MEQQRQVILLDCEDLPKWEVREASGNGRGHHPRVCACKWLRVLIRAHAYTCTCWQGRCLPLWQDVLQEAGDTWVHTRPPLGTFPSGEQVAASQLLIISGSHYSAYEELAWIQRLAQELPRWIAAYPGGWGQCGMANIAQSDQLAAYR
jgi:hypothetical protein